jgi:HEAT repeat protein
VYQAKRLLQQSEPGNRGGMGEDKTEKLGQARGVSQDGTLLAGRHRCGASNPVLAAVTVVGRAYAGPSRQPKELRGATVACATKRGIMVGAIDFHDQGTRSMLHPRYAMKTAAQDVAPSKSRTLIGAIRQAAVCLAFLAAFFILPATVLAQDPLLEMKKLLATRPAIDLFAPPEKQPQEIKKLYEQREAELRKIIDTRLNTFSELRQALLLQDWGDVLFAETIATADAKDINERLRQPDLASDIRLRARVAERFRTKVRTIVASGDADSKAAVANLVTELGLTVRAPLPPDKLPKIGDTASLDDFRREHRSGFSRSLTDEMIQLTKADSQFVRLNALRALGGINPDPTRAAAVFADQLSSKDVRARRVAADGLLRLVSIANYLREESLKKPPVSATDLDVLAATAEVVRRAPDGLADADTIVRGRCAETMHVSGSVLSELFKRTPDQIGFEAKELKPPAKSRVSRAFTHADIEGIKDALKAFGDAGPRLAGALQDPDVEVRLALVRALERLSDARARLAEEPLSIGTPDKIEDRKFLIPPEASDPLASFARGEWRAVARLLSDSDVRVRRSAVNFLEFFGDARPAVVTGLTQALLDSDRFVRWGAARALGNFSKNYQPRDGAAAVPGLARLLFDTDPVVRIAAAATLEAIGPSAEAAVPDLARAVHFGDTENRVAALYVLQAVGPERSRSAIASITDALENDHARVRRAAAETVGRYGALARNKTTIDALRRALGDEDQEVRINASEAMLQILDAGSGKE